MTKLEQLFSLNTQLNKLQEELELGIKQNTFGTLFLRVHPKSNAVVTLTTGNGLVYLESHTIQKLIEALENILSSADMRKE